MAFVVPNFNLLCKIGTSATAGFPATLPPFSIRLASQMCALVFGHRVNVFASGGTAAQGYPVMGMSLLLPVGTDVRGSESGTGILDVVECPVGTGRWYQVIQVDDIGKGYANEHRSAAILALPVWVPPYP